MASKVLVPLNSPDALPRYAQAGVGEVYMGFHDDAWTVRFGTRADLNRMSGFGAEANPFSFDEMLGQVSAARQLDMHAFVCFNAAAYDGVQADFIAREYLPAIAEAGACGVIVSSQRLVSSVVDAGMQAVVSTVAGVFNARLAAHYRDRGASRVILPRDLSLDEIGAIVEAVPDVDYEAFLMRNGCMFSDSHCLGRHCSGKPSLCMSLREGHATLRLAKREPREREGELAHSGLAIPGKEREGEGDCAHQHRSTRGETRIGVGERAHRCYSTRRETRIDTDRRAISDRAFLDQAWENEGLLARYYHRRTCGLCALWRFEQLGVAAYKVVGRGDDLDDLCADAGLVARNAKLARTCATEAEYLASMERPRQPETLCGYRGLSCYYPDKSYWASW